jgi:hypothetical protein
MSVESQAPRNLYNTFLALSRVHRSTATLWQLVRVFYSLYTKTYSTFYTFFLSISAFAFLSTELQQSHPLTRVNITIVSIETSNKTYFGRPHYYSMIFNCHPTLVYVLHAYVVLWNKLFLPASAASLIVRLNYSQTLQTLPTWHLLNSWREDGLGGALLASRETPHKQESHVLAILISSFFLFLILCSLTWKNKRSGEAVVQ